MNDLNQINEEFNNSVDDSFRLTKMFKQNGIFSKTVNTILIASFAVGAFSSVAKNLENPTPIKQKSVFSTQSESKSEIDHLSQQAVQMFGSEATRITANNIEKIIEQQSDGIFKMPDSEQLVAVVYDQNYKTGNDIEDMYINKLIELNDFDSKNPVATFGFSSIDNPDGTSAITYLAMSNGFQSKHIENFSEKYPNLAKNEDLLIFSHELSHISKGQLEYIQDKERTNDFSASLMREVSSDVFSVMAVAKIKGMNLEKTTDILSELSELRIHGLNTRNDSEHATSFALKSFSKTINDNPAIFNQMKELDLGQLDQVTSDFSLKAFKGLDNGNLKITAKSPFSSKEVRNDIQDMIDNPDTFDIKKTAIGEASGKYNATKLTRIYRESLETMVKAVKEDGMSIRRAARLDSDTLVSIRDNLRLWDTQKEILNNFEPNEKLQSELNNLVVKSTAEQSPNLMIANQQEDMLNNLKLEIDKNIQDYGQSPTKVVQNNNIIKPR